MYTKFQNKTVWIFDIDGVITNPENKISTEEALIDAIVEKLKKGEPVTANSGRSVEWILENFIRLLDTKVFDKTLFENIFVVGEKGGAWASYNKNNWKIETDKELTVPDELRQKVFDLVNDKNEPFKRIMFEGEIKRSMISPEMINGKSHEDYEKIQPYFASRLKTLVEEFENKHPEQRGLLRVDPTAIAVDIQCHLAGKGRGAERITNWLISKKISPIHYEVVGDSQSDLEMSDWLFDHGFSVNFIYVGRKGKLDEIKKLYPIYHTNAQHEAGTLEYLKNNN